MKQYRIEIENQFSKGGLFVFKMILFRLSVSLFVVLFGPALGATSTSTTTKPSSNVWEYIITDISHVLTGVSQSYYYNDTTKFPSGDGLESVPGCPKNDNGYPWILHRTSSVLSSIPRCYLAGTRGPCEFGQKIFVERGSPYGYCNCECFEGLERSVDKEVFCTPKNHIGHNANFKQVFLPKVKKCYNLYDQGPCKANEWLVEVDKSQTSETISMVKCEERRCPAGQLPTTLTGNKNSVECAYPQFSPGVAFSLSGALGKNECYYGSVYSKLLGRCVKKNFSFVF